MARLPSLDTLRVFSVAARHLSFTKAADELHLTQSAISHRVRALEECGLIQGYTALIDQQRAGFPVNVFVSITLDRQSQAGLEPLIALLSVVAVELVNLRAAARLPEQAGRPAAEVVEPVYVEVLSVWRHGEARPLTVREYTLALGRLGGHQNRKGDGLPGWQTLWRGWDKLQTMLVGIELAQNALPKCG